MFQNTRKKRKLYGFKKIMLLHCLFISEIYMQFWKTDTYAYTHAALVNTVS